MTESSAPGFRRDLHRRNELPPRAGVRRARSTIAAPRRALFLVFLTWVPSFYFLAARFAPPWVAGLFTLFADMESAHLLRADRILVQPVPRDPWARCDCSLLRRPPPGLAVCRGRVRWAFGARQDCGPVLPRRGGPVAGVSRRVPAPGGTLGLASRRHGEREAFVVRAVRRRRLSASVAHGSHDCARRRTVGPSSSGAAHRSRRRRGDCQRVQVAARPVSWKRGGGLGACLAPRPWRSRCGAALRPGLRIFRLDRRPGAWIVRRSAGTLERHGEPAPTGFVGGAPRDARARLAVALAARERAGARGIPRGAGRAVDRRWPRPATYPAVIGPSGSCCRAR